MSEVPSEVREAMARAIKKRTLEGKLTIEGHVDAALSALTASGYAVVPVKATDGLLMSMAVRYDHGLGVPGYYDRVPFGGHEASHQQRLEGTIRTMRQLHEEVVGAGFYSADREADYAALSPPAEADKGSGEAKGSPQEDAS